jgi:hypothetical protein
LPLWPSTPPFRSLPKAKRSSAGALGAIQQHRLRVRVYQENVDRVACGASCGCNPGASSLPGGRGKKSTSQKILRSAVHKRQISRDSRKHHTRRHAGLKQLDSLNFLGTPGARSPGSTGRRLRRRDSSPRSAWAAPRAEIPRAMRPGLVRGVWLPAVDTPLARYVLWSEPTLVGPRSRLLARPVPAKHSTGTVPRFGAPDAAAPARARRISPRRMISLRG